MAFVSTAATLGSAYIQSNAASKAASQQADATKNAANLTAASATNSLKEIQRQYDTTRSDYAPYRAAGVKALNQLATENDQPVTAADALAEPGYQFGLQQGQQALDRKVAASGGRVSGAALKAATEYGTNYATTGYNAAYQRRNDRLNRLSALAGIGQTATGGTSSAGTSASNATASVNSNSSNALSNLVSSQGNATAANTLSQGNIWGNALNSLASNYS